MKISLNWIKEFVDIPSKYTPKQLAELLTLRTCEVEGWEEEAAQFQSIVVGKVLSISPHPNADKLSLVKTDLGSRVAQIVCGGQNLKVGMLVAVALPGAYARWHGEGERIEIKEAKIRGEESFGMICAEEEIGLPQCTPRQGITITDLAYTFKWYKVKPSTIGTPLSEALNITDVVFEIDNKSLTHRPDLWGHYGMAREFAAFLGKKLKPLITKNTFPTKGPQVKVMIKNTAFAKRFLSTIITGIKVEPSPEWMQKRLQALGMRPINNIVDITNYVMLELGYPSHAFDRRTIGNDRLEVRRASEGEKVETLDHKKRVLSPEDMVITNGEKNLGLAGIMGGLESEIKPDATEIVLEAACWNPITIRKTSQHHSLRTDAAQRFEKSLDPEINGIAFYRVCELIKKICPQAKFEGPVTDYYPERAKPGTLSLSTDIVQKKMGVPVSEKEIIGYLKALEFSVKKGTKGSLKVEIPTFRATKDINIEDDLVEEVARMYGYEKIAPTLPALPIQPPRENKERQLKHRARNLLSLGLGFSETTHYSFYGKTEIEKALLPPELHIEIENPLTEDQTHMRISMVPNMLKAVAHNLKYTKKFKLYEIGRTYIKTKDFFPLEEKFICGMVVRPESKEEIFYEALGAVQTFLKKFPAATFHMEKSALPPPYAHPAKIGGVVIEGKEVAIVYELHPQVLQNFDIDQPIAAFEINFTRLAALGQKALSYTPLPRFPGIEIDVSVLVSKRSSVGELKNLIARTDQQLITKVKLIDIFEDKSLGEDKKSLTYRVLLQSPDRTLTDEEMKEVQTKIFKNITSGGFTIRG